MARFTVTETNWAGVPAVQLTDHAAETVALIVPSLGGNLISFTVRGAEILRRPPDAAELQEKPARWGIPVLMPPNRIEGGRFTFNGRAYQLELTDSSSPNHIHGFALRRAWQLQQVGTDGGAFATISFRAADYPDVLAQFPHPFVLSLTYCLQGQTLRCTPEIQNDGAEPMPFGLGFHPYLLAPADREQDIRLTPARAWESEHWLPTGRFRPADGPYDLTSWQPVHAVARDVGYALTTREPDGWSRFELRDRATGRLVTLRADMAYGHWVVFNGFAGTVSPEPYTCMTNAFNLDLPAAVSGMAVISGGESRDVGDWELTVS